MSWNVRAFSPSSLMKDAVCTSTFDARSAAYASGYAPSIATTTTMAGSAERVLDSSRIARIVTRRGTVGYGARMPRRAATEPRPVDPAAAAALAAQVPDAWRAVLADAVAAPSFGALATFLAAEDAAAAVFPPREERFAALAHTPPSAVKVVLLGQDPYPTRGNANGLAFSVRRGVKVPASLKNLFLGLKADLGLAPPEHGDLTAWADRGVLLLNTVLTVREGEANSHKKQGWEPFTEAVLRAVASGPPVVFFCLGKPALALVEKLGERSRHTVVAAPHPSPLNGKAFEDTARAEKVFTKVNAALTAAGRGPVDFALGAP